MDQEVYHIQQVNDVNMQYRLTSGQLLDVCCFSRAAEDITDRTTS